ncbi:dTDP-4-dehydrorhamnose reductase family protein [Paenibacillus nasutitermitis]|uniref:dTDP-4-dehydrorhamnose reductase n=1 Tax=Paenibacillus nasutitermitis TaxID=1652958 RepID=A0A916YLA4_9BACL|nr:SDR family oxidoreductase [Paenibacillus nasutitermitis]GGD49946.1 NAD(P)-dependent oxidoreductase [Paenibacillus nasutitermitis]
MKLLIIGGNGMAGHLLVRYFRRERGMEVAYTTRKESPVSEGIFLDAADGEAAAAVVRSQCPDVIINAVGILNRDAEEYPLQAYQVNGLFPHWLGHVADRIGARLIHISSDCVFSGETGGYKETDIPDGTSVYAKTKALGELKHSPHLTIRTSIIGPEIRANGIGLLAWFLHQEGHVSGYARVMWNGVTTLELAKAIAYAIGRPEIGGLVHLTAGESVSKLTLLTLFQKYFHKTRLHILPDYELAIDRTLVSARDDWRYEAPKYPAMLAELAKWMEEE